MRLRPILIFLALFAAEGALAQAYTWTDENGVVHYSDRPEPGAKQIVLPEANTIRTRARPASRTFGTTRGDEAEPAEPFQYESLEVVAPAPEETLWNIEGVLNVALAVSPALQPGRAPSLRTLCPWQPRRRPPAGGTARPSPSWS